MSPNQVLPIAAASAETIKEAGLRYSSDERPGIKRELKDGAFVFTDAQGEEVTDEATLARIKSLVIPPAWQQVWISPYANGHIQATGRDARGRKQYRYHPRWRETRDSNKFHRMTAFAQVLPRIRRQVHRDLSTRGMPRRKVLAAVVRLLETTLIRVGNDEYVRQNKSFGLTTLRNRHVNVTRTKVVFSFRGKSGKQHQISLQDRQMAALVKRCQEMPGQELFVYEDDDGQTHHIGSQDVNEYIREIAKSEFTAKDFRTWSGTVLAAVALRELGSVDVATQAKKNILMAIEATAMKLGNTPAVCRKCYVHPEVFDAYLEGMTISTLEAQLKAGARHLKAEEKAVLALLDQRLKKTRKARALSADRGKGKTIPLDHKG
ncbi:MAG: topoisomerase [Verrucomicrobiaceae bacterium]|nr:topoisomerase [Verrucomicrobiaceae bacterium]